MQTSFKTSGNLYFLSGGGEMGELTRNFNWADTPLGPPERWPQNLRLTLSMILSSRFPMFLWWGEELIQFYNDAYRPSLGNNGKHPAVGKRGKDCWPEIWDIIYPMIDQVRTTGQATWNEDQLVPIYRNGQIEDVYWTFGYSPIFGEMGLVEGVLVVCTETTEKVLTTKKLIRDERNLHNMILQAPVAMCILLGPDHVIEVANQLMIELWGKPVADVMNKPVFEALPDAKGQGLEKLMADVYNTGVAFRAYERPVVLLRNRRNDTVYQNFVYEPYKGPDGTILGIIAITIDVTPQVIARQQMEKNQAELLEIKEHLELELEADRQLQRQKDDFIGIASHELKTPLTTLSAIIQVLTSKLRNADDTFISGALDRATNQVKKMSSLINGFLNISRLESGKILIEKQRFELNHLIQEMVDEIQMISQNHTIVPSDCKNIEVFADRDKIGSVISNLLSNAVKYSPKGKNIEIRCMVNKDFAQVSIKDEGMGVKEKDLDKLFDRYYRVESNHTKYISGFGIGLYLSAEIIKQHDGRIWVESESGVGSTFHFTLPLAEG